MPGTYIVYYKAEKDGYNPLTYHRKVTINKSTITDGSKDVEVNYDGKEHTITTGFTPSDVKVMYSTDGKTYNLTSIPKYKDVGDYNIFYTVSREGYNDLSGSKTVHIYGVKGFKEGIKVKNNIIIAEWGSDFTFIEDKIIVHAKKYIIDHRDIHNQPVDSNAVKTADKAYIYISTGSYGAEYSIAIRGDVDGNGEVGIIDYIRIRKDIMDIEKLSGVYFEAADMNDNNIIDIGDYIAIKRIIMEAGA